MNKPEAIRAQTLGGTNFMAYEVTEANEFMDSQQSKLEEMEKEVARLNEGVSKTVRAGIEHAGARMAAEARVKELESQLEAAKVEGFNEGVEKAASVLEKIWTGMESMYTRVREEFLSDALTVADSKRGGE